MAIIRTLHVALAIGLLASTSLQPARAESVDSFGSLEWRSIGPTRGGRSIAVGGSTARPLEYFFGAVGGGLWKTTDGGTSWKPVTDGQIASSSVGAVAVAPSNPDVVYIGMGEHALRGNVIQGDGVYRSADGGKTWTHAGLKDSQSISRLLVDPRDPDLVYAVVLGHPYDKHAERGIFRTRDGGKTWKQVLFKSDGAGAIDLTIDPRNRNVMFAAIWDVNRKPWQLTSGGPDSGLWKSSDGGETWSEITRNPGLPAGIVGKIGVAVSGADGNRVWALVENREGGLFRSDDAGATWTKVNDERKIRQRAFYYSRIYADPVNKDVVYAMNTSFFRSEDGGKTFKAIPTLHGDNHDLWIDPANPRRMIEGNDGGASVSTNGGGSWTLESYPTAQLYHVSTTSDVPYHVCGAQQDNSTLCVPSEPSPHMRDPTKGAGEWLYPVGGGESGYIAPDPNDANMFYAGSQGGLLTRYDRRTGRSDDVEPYPEFFSGMSASVLKERWQWTFPIVFDPHDTNRIYTSSQHLFASDDRGQSWQVISPDLTRADPKTLGDSGGPITHDQNGPEIYATIFAVAPSKISKGLIWTGSDDGLAHITRDGGASWQKVTPGGLPDFARISIIDASHHEPGTAYLAANRYQMGDRSPYLYRTHDFGKSWTKIVKGIPATDFPRVIREDPVRKGLLYAGTEHGIYVSLDDGDSWQSLRLNLPDTQVSDITIKGSDVVISTHGRSFYILDDVDWLRQYDRKALANSLHVYAPRAMTLQVDEATIDYNLTAPAKAVTVEILKDGAVIASFKNAAEGEAKPVEEGRRRRTKPPTTNAGLNRFVWNGQHSGSPGFPGMILWSASSEMGPRAVPGDYQVRITADAATQVQPLRILPDPRYPEVTQRDLQQQFDLASAIRTDLSAANATVASIRKIRQVIADARGNAAIAAAAQPMLARLKIIEESLYQVQNRSGQDPLNFPIKLNNQIATLGRKLMESYGAPPAQFRTVYEELHGELQTQLDAYAAATGEGFAAVNPLLIAAKGAPLSPRMLEAVTLRPEPWMEAAN
ncbi:VPS10 domain-containing protein [Novosphingobium album (ex Liu et al. 2023)]|uniref:Glycosyl hydrolase n=1 Tax=Novosphingobium album (ex Liu et al. 2023) TaxID=3031130 RepID=A0ABT5WPQ6_9SPHN|nr:glycosyl hydrolase [Novosphingobium album (ex Liu et al. 2023)]MDE8652028.1 glycosyl hydrolase [Novosphingobium album (ex Liu et al. 2023)]